MFGAGIGKYRQKMKVMIVNSKRQQLNSIHEKLVNHRVTNEHPLRL